jgi:hypothetical protein
MAFCFVIGLSLIVHSGVQLINYYSPEGRTFRENVNSGAFNQINGAEGIMGLLLWAAGSLLLVWPLRRNTPPTSQSKQSYGRGHCRPLSGTPTSASLRPQPTPEDIRRQLDEELETDEQFEERFPGRLKAKLTA